MAPFWGAGTGDTRKVGGGGGGEGCGEEVVRVVVKMHRSLVGWMVDGVGPLSKTQSSYTPCSTDPLVHLKAIKFLRVHGRVPVILSRRRLVFWSSRVQSPRVVNYNRAKFTHETYIQVWSEKPLFLLFTHPPEKKTVHSSRYRQL